MKWQLFSMQCVVRGTQPKCWSTAWEKKTHSTVDEDPQKFSSNGLQPLAIVQLSQGDLSLKDVALHDDLEQPLIHGHHFLCQRKNWSPTVSFSNRNSITIFDFHYSDHTFLRAAVTSIRCDRCDLLHSSVRGPHSMYLSYIKHRLYGLNIRFLLLSVAVHCTDPKIKVFCNYYY